MTVIATVLTLALLTWLISGYLDHRTNPNRAVANMRAGSNEPVILVANDYQQYITPLLINGHKVIGLVDTGATDIAMSDQLAQRLQLSLGTPFPIQTANGVTYGRSTVLDSVQLGNIYMEEVAAISAPGISDDIVLVGMSFLKHIDWYKEGDALILRGYSQ